MLVVSMQWDPISLQYSSLRCGGCTMEKPNTEHIVLVSQPITCMCQNAPRRMLLLPAASQRELCMVGDRSSPPTSGSSYLALLVTVPPSILMTGTPG